MQNVHTSPCVTLEVTGVPQILRQLVWLLFTRVDEKAIW